MSRLSKSMLIILLSWITVVISAPIYAETITVVPKGEYAQINTQLTNETINILINGNYEDKQKTIESIKATPEKYAPPVFYVLSQVLFLGGQKDEAAFWFYAGQLRARFDANRCADYSARQAVSMLNQYYGGLINEYTLQDIPKLEELVPRVVEWDRKTPHDYDHRWINLSGMGAVRSGLESPGSTEPALSLPKEQWETIAEETRTDYLNSFKEVMAQIRDYKK